jgi:hypothetical protein
MLQRHSKLVLSAMVLSTILSMWTTAHATGIAGGLRGAFGPRYSASPRFHPRPHPRTTAGVDTLRRWKGIAIDASGLDHTPVAAGETRKFGEQLGPTRASRAMAIVHIAMFDAVNAIFGGYESYTRLPRAPFDVSLTTAVAQAAHDTLVALFPSQTASFDDELAADLATIHDGRFKSNGIKLGQRAASAILALRADDGSDRPEPLIGTEHPTSDEPGHWRQDPISHAPLALGAYWSEVTPFSLQSADQFRVPPPPALDSAEYAAAFAEVKALGGDVVHTATSRTADQTQTGIFWAYDGTPSMCAPPRLYNQIVVHIADQMHTTWNVVAFARLLALANLAMADAGIAVWDSKYFYDFWRPVTGIRESDPGTGPTSDGDANPATTGDPDFWPLGAPASNLLGPNFTPPFPAYPSGHAGFGGALFETLRNFYRRDNIAFTFTSDEFNGTTLDNQGNVRPLLPRSFASLSQAEEENGQSRIYLGIHWAFDKSEGIMQGERVADYVFQNELVPVRGLHW